VVLEATALLINKGKSVKVVFTGKQSDNRNPKYNVDLMNFVKQNQLESSTYFLGFIERQEQLKLMQHSIAVIQPSLFEGWSTVIEDAKALNVPMIVSDIEVHREQLGDYNLYFQKHNSSELADKMEVVQKSRPKIAFNEYQLQIRKFGIEFMCIAQEILK
jgi:glycosyltransferase involved in cell wall biosynthesis